MYPRILLTAAAALALGNPANAQLMPGFGIARYATPAPGLGYGHLNSYAGVRDNSWAVNGRYNAFAWSGPGVYTGRQAAFGTVGYYSGYGLYGNYFWPRYSYGFNTPLSLDTPFFANGGYWPYTNWAYNAWYPSVATYAAEQPMVAYVPPAAPSTPPMEPDYSATIAVSVPFSATVTVQGAATKQMGDKRTFVSPPLEPGREYEYTIKAQWKDGAKSVEQSQTVTVRAGERSSVIFMGS